MTTAKVKVLRPFNATPQGGILDVGAMVEVDEVRGQELVRAGLAELMKPAAKVAPDPQNKMAPAPENKAPSAEPVRVRRVPAKQG